MVTFLNAVRLHRKDDVYDTLGTIVEAFLSCFVVFVLTYHKPFSQINIF